MRRLPAIACVALAACSSAAAQTYPAGHVRVFVGAPRGSAADITARVIGVKFYEATGQQFDVDNRPGSGGNAAAAAAAGSPADGHALLAGTVTNAINATLYPKLAFDFLRDFVPVTLAVAEPGLLIVHPATPVKSVKDLVALAKSRPGQLTLASPGSGSLPHLSGELFRTLAGIGLSHAPARDEPLALAGLLGGKADLMFAPVSSAHPHLEGGRLRALAATSSARVASLPGLPTVAEAGVAGYEAKDWVGFLAPAQTPPAIVTRINAEIAAALKLPDVRSQFELQDFEILGDNPARFADFVRAETARWAKVIRQSGTRID